MAGWDKSSGELLKNDEDTLWKDISNTLYRSAHQSTYKYALLKSICDNLFNADDSLHISFEVLNESFATIYWNLINVHHVPQAYYNGRSDECQIEIDFKALAREISSEIPLKFESLSFEQQERVKRKSLPIFKKYVVGALYADTNGHIYGFSKAKNSIWLNWTSLSFLAKNKVVIEHLNYYEWLKMCEKILDSKNSSIDNLSTKLEDITKRADLSFFKDQLKDFSLPLTCFYCGKPLKKGFPLDHVIPWSFIKRDDLWNLTYCCSTCNSSKSDCVPSSRFIEKLIKRNEECHIPSPNIKEIVKVASENGVRTDWEPKQGRDKDF